MDEQARLLAHGNSDDKGLIAGGGATAAVEERQLADALRAVAAVHAIEEVPQHARRGAAGGRGRRGQPEVDRHRRAADGGCVRRSRTRSNGSCSATIALALLGTVVLGWLWGRSFIQRIFALTKVTRALAAGRMDERVTLSGQDEIQQLGDAFNSMADRLVELQEDVRKQERQAMFGRIAAGLVHDLSHPIQNIGNSCKLIQKMFEDLEYRETFKKTVERELVIVKRVLDDLRNIARPIPLERFPVDLNRAVADAAESMEQHAVTAGLTLRTELTPETLFIEGDVFALGRVYRNLILNAIQATAPGGLIVVASEGRGDSVQVRIYDTGCGIPPERLVADLRGLRHDEAPRPRARPGDFQEDRRAARRADLGRERSREGHDVRARLPAHGRAADAGGGIEGSAGSRGSTGSGVLGSGFSAGWKMDGLLV